MARSKFEPVAVPQPHSEQGDRYAQARHTEAHSRLVQGYGSSLAETQTTRHRALDRYITQGYTYAGQELSDQVHDRQSSIPIHAHGKQLHTKSVKLLTCRRCIYFIGRAGIEGAEWSRRLYEAAARADPINVTYAKGLAASTLLAGDVAGAIRGAHHAAELALMPRFRERVTIGTR